MSNGKNIILGVTGSIAAYKAVEVASQLTKHGCEVRVVLTADAQRFITPLCFKTLSRHPVVTDLYDEEEGWKPAHIRLADEADLLLIAPATANNLAKLAHGLADDALTCIALAVRPEAPLLLAPAMNGKMWLHPATQQNVTLLRQRGAQFIGPEEGLLSCGYEGLGRLWPVEAIVDAVLKRLTMPESGPPRRDAPMQFAPRQWFSRFLASLEVPTPEAADRLHRIEVVELHFVLPLKVAAILMLVQSFRTSPWFGLALSTLDVAVETVQTISVIYVAANLVVTGVLLFSRRMPLPLVQWSIFGICLADAVFLSGVTVLTGGYDSILYWLYVGLIVRNAASIPPAWSQAVLNLGVCVCYVMSGVLDIAVTESTPEAFSAGPRSALLSTGEIKNPAQFIQTLKREADPVSGFLWRQFSPQVQQAMTDPALAPSERTGRLVEELNRVLRGRPIYEAQRFSGLKLRSKTRSLLEANPAGERLVQLNRLLLEDAYPQEIARGQGPRQLVVTEPATETPTEPLVIRLCVLLLTAACCYGVQVLLEKQRLAVEEAREFAVREGQLRSAGRLAAEIAHQLKNPLAIINTTAFSLERGLKTGKGLALQQLAIIKEEVERADRTITQLMGYAQLCESHVERLDVAAELAQAIRSVFPPGAGYPAQVVSECAPNLPPLLMQRSHLSAVLVNLLLNAREATGGGGRITVSAHATRDNAVEFLVADNGPGIPADKLERVFEAYYSTKEKGTGLGLAIAKHNAELYGGTIRVESELGNGARFRVIFPAKTRI